MARIPIVERQHDWVRWQRLSVSDGACEIVQVNGRVVPADIGNLPSKLATVEPLQLLEYSRACRMNNVIHHDRRRRHCLVSPRRWSSRRIGIIVLIGFAEAIGSIVAV